MSPEELDRIDIYRHEVSEVEGIPICTINEKLRELIEMQASWFVKHYKESYEKHWDENEERNNFMGLVGQKALEIILQKESIPYTPNDPLTSRVYYKPYDFFVPKLGTIEVKTIPSYGQYVIVKASEWHGSNFLVAWRLQKEKLSMVGWLQKDEVEIYPIIPKGEHKCTPLAAARVIPTEKLHEPKTFITKLKEAKAKCMKP